VAREAAALVLLNDDFASLVTTSVWDGRILTICASDELRAGRAHPHRRHGDAAGLLANRWLLLPAHIMFLQLIIDPACSIFI